MVLGMRLVHTRNCALLASLVLRPSITARSHTLAVIEGLGTRLVHYMYILTMNSIFDHGNFEAMKTLSSWEVACCDERHSNMKAGCLNKLLVYL